MRSTAVRSRLEAGTAEFESSRPEYHVTVRVTESGNRSLVSRSAWTIRGQRRVGRGHQVVVDLERIEYAESQLLSLGSGVEVLAPEELRLSTTQVSLAIASNYRRQLPRSARPRGGKLTG